MSVDERSFGVVLDAERGGADPPYLHHDYVGTRLRAPKDPLVIVPATLGDVTAPAFGESAVEASDSDLTRQHAGEPLGQRIDAKIGSNGKRGSSGKYICVMSRSEKARPKTEKWMWAGRHAFGWFPQG